jgi:hypothetical protein
MSRNKQKRQGNSTTRPSSSGGGPASPVTNDSPEVKEGKDEKQQLIAEGEAQKEKLIAEGQAEKEKIIEKAKADAQKTASDERDKIIARFKEEALKDAEDEYKNIISRAKELESELDAKSKLLEEKSNKLEKQNKECLEKSLKLDSEKDSYKNEILSGVQNEIEELQNKIKNLEESKHQLEQEKKQLEQNISFSNTDKKELENELNNYDALYQENSKLRMRISVLESGNNTLSDIRQELRSELEKKDSLILCFGDNPQQILSENDSLKEENGKLKDRIANFPDTNELEMLRERYRQYSQIQQQNDMLQKEKSQLEKQLSDAKTYQADLENKDRFIRVLDLQCSELQTELDRITDRYNKNSLKVFAGLSKIDDEQSYASYGNSNISLKDLCNNFKNYLASQKGLFYTDTHIRTFIAGFVASKLIILEGMSGTGKSSLPREFGEYIGSPTARIPVQSSWKDRNDLIGFYNDFEKRYKETEFLKAIYRAVKDKDNIHCIILDEMNLSRIEYYFADLLSVLEEPNPKNWKINLLADAASIKGEVPKYIKDGELVLTENIWFAGTANKDDSTFTITDKVYDRAIVLDFKERAQKSVSASKQQPKGGNLSFSEFQTLIEDAIKCSAEKKKEIENTISWLDERMKPFEISFGNRISSQIEKFVPAYVKCGGEITEAFDIIFSTKVLRKIRGYDKSTENGLAILLSEINGEYQKESDFNFSKYMIEKLRSRI